MVKMLKALAALLRPAQTLPPPDRSCLRAGELADYQARYAARLERQQ